MFAVVLILNPTSTKELILTYAIREGQLCLPGMLFYVTVKGRKEEALVLRLHKHKGGSFSVLELGDAVFAEVILSRRGIALARWISRYYVCTLNKAAALFLPPPTRSVRETRYYMVKGIKIQVNRSPLAA
jgi:primosomal protein N'